MPKLIRIAINTVIQTVRVSNSVLIGEPLTNTPAAHDLDNDGDPDIISKGYVHAQVFIY